MGGSLPEVRRSRTLSLRGPVSMARHFRVVTLGKARVLGMRLAEAPCLPLAALVLRPWLDSAAMATYQDRRLPPLLSVSPQQRLQ